MAPKLTKSHRDKMLFGVCSGLGEYLDIDSILVRLAFLVLAFAGGVGIIAYIGLAILMPAPGASRARPNIGASPGEEPPQGSAGGQEEIAQRRRRVVGIVVLVVGLVFLLANFSLFWWFSWDRFWPLIIIGAGVFLIFGHFRRQ